jgi:hypothetical protein
VSTDLPPPSEDASPQAADGAPGPWIRVVRTSRWPNWPRWAVLMVVGWLAFGYLADALARRTGTPGPSCVFKRITTQPCPTCGSGRGSLALLRGDVPAALRFNPLYFTLLGLGALLLGFRLVFARKVALRLGRWGRRLAWGAFGALVVANWVYLIVAGI